MASLFSIRAKTILQHSPLVLTYSVLRRNMFRSRHDQPILTSLRLSYISRPTCHRHSVGKPYCCTLFLSETTHFCNYHIPNSRIVVGTGHRSTIFIFGIIDTPNNYYSMLNTAIIIVQKGKLPQSVAEKVTLYVKPETEETCQIDSPCRPEGYGIAVVLGKDAS